MQRGWEAWASLVGEVCEMAVRSLFEWERKKKVAKMYCFAGGNGETVLYWRKS